MEKRRTVETIPDHKLRATFQKPTNKISLSTSNTMLCKHLAYMWIFGYDVRFQVNEHTHYSSVRCVVPMSNEL